MVTITRRSSSQHKENRLTHIGLSIEFVTFGLLLIGSIPVALALLTSSDAEASQRVSASPVLHP
ncbi:MAG: hypothetical protein M3Y74_06805 [Chloroflexota bacterium]|nr:hypothetical protein [Chloroflexota bacterium]